MEKVKQIFCADKNICPVIAKQNAQNKWELWHLSNCHEREEAKYEHRLFKGHAYEAVEATESTTGRTLIKVLEDGIWREIILIQPPIVADMYISTAWIPSSDASSPMWIRNYRIDTEGESLEDLLERGAGIKTILIDLASTLYWAYVKNAKNVASIIDYFLKNGIDVNEKDEWGKTALMNACCGRDSNIVRLLLENGAKVNEKDKRGTTALMNACHARIMKIYRLFKENDVNVNEIEFSTKTRFMFPGCIWNVEIDIIKLLLDHGAWINEKDKDGKTALTYACRKSNLDAVKLLLEHGAKVNDII